MKRIGITFRKQYLIVKEILLIKSLSGLGISESLVLPLSTTHVMKFIDAMQIIVG